MISVAPKQAVVLAGGFGTRLQAVVRDVPKPMAPVAGRPFLELLIDYWINQGIQSFILSVGYKSDEIENYFRSDYRNCPIRYIHEEVPLGTGGGLRKVILESTWHNDEALLINGDTWFEVDMVRFTEDARSLGCPITIALKPIKHNDRYGGVSVNSNGRVDEFNVKGVSPCLINGGCYIMDVPELEKYLQDYPEKFSLEDDFLVPMAANGKITASIQDETFLDIGVPTDYEKAEEIINKRLYA